MPKKKKQHYVPQCYLNAWAIPDTHQVYVFVKMLQTRRRNSIEDIASEKYFYDIDFTGIVSEEDLKNFGLDDCNPANLDDGQYIENFFATKVEGNYRDILNKIISRTRQMNLWEMKNCFFISEYNKFLFSFHLAYQIIRVKAVRNSLMDSQDCLVQALKDMRASQETIARYGISESHLPFIHGKMILDRKEIDDISKCFLTLSWILLVNRTGYPFFTSDSPIGTIAHIQHPICSMTGLASRGVEVYFPISPDLMLIMADGEYHKLDHCDRRILAADNIDEIRYYNSKCIINSERCVFSSCEDFSIVDEMIKENPKILHQPHSMMQWGGKTYTPQRNKEFEV